MSFRTQSTLFCIFDSLINFTSKISFFFLRITWIQLKIVVLVHCDFSLKSKFSRLQLRLWLLWVYSLTHIHIHKHMILKNAGKMVVGTICIETSYNDQRRHDLIQAINGWTKEHQQMIATIFFFESNLFE